MNWSRPRRNSLAPGVYLQTSTENFREGRRFPKESHHSRETLVVACTWEISATVTSTPLKRLFVYLCAHLTLNTKFWVENVPSLQSTEEKRASKNEERSLSRGKYFVSVNIFRRSPNNADNADLFVCIKSTYHCRLILTDFSIFFCLVSLSSGLTKFKFRVVIRSRKRTGSWCGSPLLPRRARKRRWELSAWEERRRRLSTVVAIGTLSTITLWGSQTNKNEFCRFRSRIANPANVWACDNTEDVVRSCSVCKPVWQYILRERAFTVATR